jgi:hypothetical protein
MFTIDGQTLAPIPLVNGQAEIVTSSLGVGSHTVSVAYSGDARYNASTSPNTIVNIARAATTTTVAASGTPSVFGQSVTFTATVAAAAPGAGLPTGIVNFFSNGAPIGSAPLDNGVATLAVGNLPVGANLITAAYGSDGNFNGSSSPELTQTVNPASTTIVVGSSNANTVFGQSVTFTATISVTAPGAGAPTGTVTFFDGVTPLGAAPVSGGAAVFTTNVLTVGSHSITAQLPARSRRTWARPGRPRRSRPRSIPRSSARV